MGDKHIPEVGQLFLGDIPAVKKLLHVTVGSATTNDVVVGDIEAKTLVDVTVPIVVTDMWTQVEVAFTASVTLDIGDSGSAARYTSDTTINSAASGAVLVSATGLAVPYINSTPDDILVTVGGATVAAGLLHVYIEYYELQD